MYNILALYNYLVKEYFLKKIPQNQDSEGCNRSRARGVLIAMELKKCTLSILFPKLFLDKQSQLICIKTWKKYQATTLVCVCCAVFALKHFVPPH